MRRDLMQKLIEWKTSSGRKPLILKGARQVGKTWLMREFGRTQYNKTAYVNFDGSDSLKQVFSDYTNVPKLLSAIKIETGVNVTAGNTLIIFDEIQECPQALTALKYFNENANEYHIIAAGSLLGVSHHAGTGFPVGKVNFLELYPLNFLEFLDACGENRLREAAENMDTNLTNVFSQKFTDLLRYYYYVGGMPEVVRNFAADNDFSAVRRLQNEILAAYKADFSKHTDAGTAERIAMLWESIASQLAKENKKFIYKAVKQGARAKEYETAIAWLHDCGLVHTVYRISKPGLPLKAYEEPCAFKLYILDTGLLGALSGLSAKTIIQGNSIFTEFKGALTEQYVLQQLKCISDLQINYWTSKSGVAEIDFVVQLDNCAVPVEVKASTNLRAKSLTQYIKDYTPEYAVKTSLANFETNEKLYNIPLYLIGLLDKFAEKHSAIEKTE